MKIHEAQIPAGTFRCPGLYQWFDSRAEAESASVPGEPIAETTPGRLWRACVRVDPPDTASTARPKTMDFLKAIRTARRASCDLQDHRFVIRVGTGDDDFAVVTIDELNREHFASPVLATFSYGQPHLGYGPAR